MVELVTTQRVIIPDNQGLNIVITQCMRSLLKCRVNQDISRSYVLKTPSDGALTKLDWESHCHLLQTSRQLLRKIWHNLELSVAFVRHDGGDDISGDDVRRDEPL